MELTIEQQKWLEQLSIAHGSHSKAAKAFCVMEAVAYIAGEPHPMAATGGPAHPVFIVQSELSPDELRQAQQQLSQLAPGVSVWDFYAGAALTGWLAGYGRTITRVAAEDIARGVAHIADAMMIERKASREARPLPPSMPEPSHGEER